MKDKVIELLSKNESLIELLEEFKKDFEKAYYRLNKKERENILKFRDAIFRLWLYSPIMEETYITPNYLVNNIAKQNLKGDYTVIPHIKTRVNKEEKLEFETRWIYYSIDNAPVIEDVEKLINHAIPSLTVRSENIYVVDGGEELIDKLNFRSGYYIEYLIDLSVKLGILKEMKAIGCRAYQVSKDYENYKGLDNSEKIKLIVKSSIDIANNNLKEQGSLSTILYRNNNDFIMDLLNDGVGEEVYYKYIEELALDVNDFLGNLDSYVDDKKVIKELKDMNNIFGEGLAEQLVIEELGIFVDMFFTSVFGYYLGLIIPVYEDLMIMDTLVNFIKNPTDSLQTLGYIFKLELGHDLTPFGKFIIKDYRKKFKNKNFNDFNLRELKMIIGRYKLEKAAFLDGLKSMNLFDDLTSSDNIQNILEDVSSSELSQEISVHLDEFYNYLKDIKNLKISTCEKSTGNIELFVVNYLGFTEKKELVTIQADKVEEYLGNWFIRKVATSKNSIKEQISAINQYTRFLEAKGYINKDIVKSIKDTIKDKDKYFKKLDSFFEDDEIPF